MGRLLGLPKRGPPFRAGILSRRAKEERRQTSVGGLGCPGASGTGCLQPQIPWSPHSGNYDTRGDLFSCWYSGFEWGSITLVCALQQFRGQNPGGAPLREEKPEGYVCCERPLAAAERGGPLQRTPTTTHGLTPKDLDKLARNIPTFTPDPAGGHDVHAYFAGQ
ncbi:hypothetical protein QQF64_023372 [Cirrhinus molitorella]|uniref:Uncharacterized protein n=1 Tax=Cirrhinus molitorella TaxID=172907 RepID=A0ABR3L7B4_9TELE